ncbi:MAG: PP0621 family protein [Gammaproteobacteria bacterium]
MSRILFWVALACLVVAAIRSKLRSAGMKPPASAARGPAQRAAAGHAAGQIESMACCAHCHVYFPASEAVRADGLDYCSPAHVRLPPA